jgi:acyl-coenzyme A synthetase/AMP-(fatty) acid ligase
MQVADRHLFRTLIRHAADHPGNRDSVLADAAHECRYPQLPGHLDAIQQFLTAHGARSGDCITLELNNSVRAALTILALLDAGFSVATVPVAGHGARSAGSDSAHPRFSRLVVSIDTEKPRSALEDSLPSSFLHIRENEAFDPAAAVPEADDPRIYFRTSGSLGAAKLVMYRYRSYYRNVCNAFGVREFDPSYRIALPTPIFHCYGLGGAFLPALAGGCSIDFQERSNVLRFFEREEAFGPNVAYLTPSFCEMLVRARRTPRRYRFMITGGDRISKVTFRRSEDLHGLMLSQYGATELGVVSATPLDMPFELRSQTVGQPLPGVEFRIVPVAAGGSEEQGELQIRHTFGFEAYVDMGGRPMTDAKVFDGDWYRTGDLAAEGPDGTLIVLGRCDLSVNRHGMLLPLADVESRMRELPGVDEVAVAVGPESIRGRKLLAFCVLGDGIGTTGDALRAIFAARNPAFSVPEFVQIVHALPKLPSGKVDRQALAKLASEVQ